jgi:hypothetical protein
MSRRLAKLALPLLAGWFAPAPARADTPMTFFMVTDPQERWVRKTVGNGVEDIYAAGEITEGTTDRFLAFVRQNKVEAAEIHFNSPGGSLVEGMRLGRVIRTLQYFTTIGVYRPRYDPNVNPDLSSICASACAYAFAGGTSRFLDASTGKLGIHQFYSDEDSISGEAVQQVSGLIVAYLEEMGIDAKAFTISTIADRNGMIWLTPDDAAKLRFANNGNEAPTAEIKLVGMQPYLRIEQDHYNVTVRVLFGCENKRIFMTFGIVTNPTTTKMLATNQKRTYFELDGKEFLVTPGAAGGQARDSVMWINRLMTPETLVQVIKANTVGAWIDGFGAVRWGGTLDMPTIRGKIADYATQCYGNGKTN